jgi:hypothetical protein
MGFEHSKQQKSMQNCNILTKKIHYEAGAKITHIILECPWMVGLKIFSKSWLLSGKGTKSIFMESDLTFKYIFSALEMDLTYFEYLQNIQRIAQNFMPKSHHYFRQNEWPVLVIIWVFPNTQ